MTNKQERFLVMSEAELVAYGEACLNGPAEQIVEAEAACRAREVVASSDAPSGVLTTEVWVEIEKKGGGVR